MGWIACLEEYDEKDTLDCLDEDWQGTGMCRYCWSLEEYEKAKALAIWMPS